MAYREKSGKFRAVKMINGKRKTKSFDTKAEAKKWEAKQTEGQWIEAGREIVTALQWASDYMDYAKEQFVTVTYRSKKRAFIRFFKTANPDSDIEQLDNRLALKALRYVATQHTGGAANEDRKHLSAGWAWGVKYMGLPKDNPFSEVEKFNADERVKVVPTEEEFWKIYNVARDKDKPFLLTALHTAARKGELFRLTWSDVDFENSVIRLGTRKHGGGMKYDWVAMTSVLSAELLAHKKTANSIYVFSQRDGQPYTVRTNFMRKLCKRAGTRHFGIHALRHMSATTLARAGLSITEVQRVLRHHNPMTTTRYIEKLGVVSDKVEEVFVGKKEKAPKVVNFGASKEYV